MRGPLDGNDPATAGGATWTSGTSGSGASAQSRAVAQIFGIRLTGFPAWWVRRTYYLFQMPRWDRRLRIVLDWTVALIFRPDTTKVDLAVEQEQARRNCAAGVAPPSPRVAPQVDKSHEAARA